MNFKLLSDSCGCSARASINFIFQFCVFHFRTVSNCSLHFFVSWVQWRKYVWNIFEIPSDVVFWFWFCKSVCHVQDENVPKVSEMLKRFYLSIVFKNEKCVHACRETKVSKKLTRKVLCWNFQKWNVCIRIVTKNIVIVLCV